MAAPIFKILIKNKFAITGVIVAISIKEEILYYIINFDKNKKPEKKF